jgi:hypothetical protein
VAFVSISLSGHPAPAKFGPSTEVCRDWLWIVGEGWASLASREKHDLAQYLDHIWCELLSQEEYVPKTPYRVFGGTAMARENGNPGSGYVTWADPEIEEPIEGLLDGCGIFSRDPVALVDEVKRLAS